jgi:hypothetical protein
MDLVDEPDVTSGPRLCPPEIDECSTLSPCHVDANCTATNTFFECTCKSGYTGDGFNTCEDIDECATNSNHCAVEATCSDIDGSYTCACNTGYTGDGFDCSEITG